MKESKRKKLDPTPKSEPLNEELNTNSECVVQEAETHNSAIDLLKDSLSSGI